MFWRADQLRPKPASAFIEAGEIPLGHVATPKGRLFVFPNSHIHKLSKLFSESAKVTRRRVIVFWVVDPDVTIVSTRDVAPQQPVMKRTEAMRIRLKLMEERKRHKGKFNIRRIRFASTSRRDSHCVVSACRPFALTNPPRCGRTGCGLCCYPA